MRSCCVLNSKLCDRWNRWPSEPPNIVPNIRRRKSEVTLRTGTDRREGDPSLAVVDCGNFSTLIGLGAASSCPSGRNGIAFRLIHVASSWKMGKMTVTEALEIKWPGLRIRDAKFKSLQDLARCLAVVLAFKLIL